MKWRTGAGVGFALALALTLLLVGCTVPTAPHGPGTSTATVQTPGSRMFGTFGAAAIASVTDLLTRAGIEVDSDSGQPVTTVSGTPSPVHVNQTQLRNLTLEVTAGAGTRGATLDALVPHPAAGSPGPAEWIAAYAHSEHTVGGEAAAKLLDGQDLHDAGGLVIPTLVQVLFVSDITTSLAPAIAAQNPQAAGPTDETASLSVRSRPGLELASAVGTNSGPCETFGGPISSVISDVLQTLKQLRITAPTIRTGIPFLDSLVQGIVDLSVGALNFAIQAGAQIVVAAASFALAPILNAIALGAGAVAIVFNVLNAVKSWSVKVVPKAPTTSMSVEGQSPITDDVTAKVDLGGLTDWPAALKACAGLINVTLPSLRPGAAEVFWSPLVLAPSTVDLAHVTEHQDVLHDTAAGGEATLTIQTGVETKKQAENAGGAHPGIVRVDVRIRRKEFKDLETSVRDIVAKMLAGPLRTGIGTLDEAVQGFIATPIDAMLNEILKAGLDDTASEFVTVVYHDPPQPKGAPTPGPSSGDANWHGHWQSGTNAAAEGTFSMNIVLTSTSLSGTITIDHSACATSGTVNGRVNGTNVTFGSVQAGLSVQYQGTISADGTTMQGTYNSQACGTQPDTGTWSAHRG